MFSFLFSVLFGIPSYDRFLRWYECFDIAICILKVFSDGFLYVHEFKISVTTFIGHV